MIWFDNNDNIITTTIIMIIKPEGRQLRKQCWQEQGPRWPENKFDYFAKYIKWGKKKDYLLPFYSAGPTGGHVEHFGPKPENFTVI